MHSHTRLLVLEDSRGDALLFKMGMRERDDRLEAEFVNSIEMAQSKLEQQATDFEAVIVDLRLRSENGLELIAWLRDRPALAKMSTVVLSSSSRQADIELARSAGADAYFEKKVGLKDSLILMERLCDYVSGRIDAVTAGCLIATTNASEGVSAA